METNVLSNVTLRPRKLTGAELDRIFGGLKIKLTQVIVSSYQLGGSHGDDTPITKQGERPDISSLHS